MTNFVSSIPVDTVIEKLALFITQFMQGGQVARTQVNRVPQLPAPCAYLTELLQVDLEIPYQTYNTVDSLANINGPQQIDIQVDIYGAAAGEICKAVKSAFRTEWGTDQFPANVKPLYTNDGVQSPLIGAEQQYESRWTLTVSMQYNPVITVPQQFADEAVVATLEPADIFVTII